MANFQSIKHPQELLLHRKRKNKRIPLSDSDTFMPAEPVVAIYGPNASGKSTLVDALHFFVSAVKNSYRVWEIDSGVPAKPFLLDEESRLAPMEFEVEFIAADGVRYQYGFQVLESRIHSEWLYAYRTARGTLLFERYEEEGTTAVSFGNTFRGEKKQIEEIAQLRSNSLVLSIATQLGNAMLLEVYRWFSNNIGTYEAAAYAAGISPVVEKIEGDKEFAQKMSRVLSMADLGVSGVRVEEQPLSQEELEHMLRLVEALNNSVVNSEQLKKKLQNNKQIVLTHTGQGNEFTLPFSSESDGTMALIAIANIVIEALETGTTIVIDEIDSSLHPLLVAELVEVFQDVRSNPKHAQLIFTTHDTSLLNKSSSSNKLLAREQIWITEKNIHGETSFVALDEYKPRAEENLERGYLTGRYGGIPSLGVFDIFRTLNQEPAPENVGALVSS
ncbi:MAG: AAA family ATPase [Microbacteriaceae bacterium]